MGEALDRKQGLNRVRKRYYVLAAVSVCVMLGWAAHATRAEGKRNTSQRADRQRPWDGRASTDVPTIAANANIPGTNSSDVILMGMDSQVPPHYWYQLNAQGPFDGGPGLTSFTVWGKRGNDRIDARGIPVVAPLPIDIPLIAYGGDHSDSIYGGTARDILRGDGGTDFIRGGNGNDVIYGGSGGDALFGESGNDYIRGGPDNDYIRGGSGVNILVGDSGNDRIYGGPQRDYIFGGTGGDRLHGNGGNDYIRGGGSKDRLYGESGADYLLGDAGHDYLWGGTGADGLWGGTSGDVLKGDRHNDRLFGEDGSDKLYGGNESDYLDGGAGRDYCYGQKHVDTVLGGAGDRDTCVGGPDTFGETIDGGPGLSDRCSECGPDNCAAACEVQTAIPYAEIAAWDPVTVVFNPSNGLLTLQGEFIDVIADGEAWAQTSADEIEEDVAPCLDPVIGALVLLGDTFLTGTDGLGRYTFSPDVTLDLKPGMSGSLYDVTLDPATDEFVGTLDVTSVETGLGSRLMQLIGAASVGTIECTILDSDAVAALRTATSDFTAAGEATGALTCTIPADFAAAGIVLEDCTNGIDDNGNGCVDCDDADCADDPSCTEQNCNDSVDNDGDSLVDCDDDDCLDDAACSEQDCSDAVDNDGDTFVDCADDDCIFREACAEDCTDGLDNNGNGLIDCADPVCQGEDICLEFLHCADGIDNDENGDTDCNDAGCAFEDVCNGGEGCCFGDSCEILTPRACEDAGGEPLGPGTDCSATVDGPACVGDIPTVSEWGLAITALLLLAAGTVVLNHRRGVPA